MLYKLKQVSVIALPNTTVNMDSTSGEVEPETKRQPKMKTAILILIALLTSGCVSSSPKLSFSEVGGDGAVYTITGKKDPRLEARYFSRSTSPEVECIHH